METKIENKDICAKCGGKCCKGCGCVYVAKDFENIKIDYLEEILRSGRVSIVSHLDFQLTANGRPYTNTTLYIRERNTNRGAIDLVSITTQCASLEENGCCYDIDHRPTGGAALTPNYPNDCTSAIPESEMLATWLPYQNILRRLVKRFTGLSVEQKIRQDVEELAYKIISNKKESYESQFSRNFLTLILEDFEIAFPNEVANGRKRALSETPFALIRKTK